MRPMALGTALTAVFAATLFARVAVAAEFAPVCSDWDVVATPNGGKGSYLTSVDAFDASNVWAIGSNMDDAGEKGGAPLAMRWDGSAWAAEPPPDLTFLGTQPTFEAVGIAPTGDPWVVGHLRAANSGAYVPLILQWSGGFWEAHHIAMMDSFAPRFPLLRDVAAFGQNDAWVVGEAQTFVKDAIEPFAAHWNGIAWSEVVVPGTTGGNRILTAVSAVAPNAVWAVGYDVDLSTNASYARIYHFDGRDWSVVDQPAATKAGSVLHDIVALAADDVWAVGVVGTDDGLFLHWDGSSWTWHSAPANADPRSVDGAASNDVWAAGARGNYHWDGTSWSFLPSANKPDSGVRRALAVAGPCDVWSISSWSDNAGSASLIERLGPSAPAPERPATPIAFVAKPTSSKEIALEWLPGGDDPKNLLGFVIERRVGEAEACPPPFTVIGKVRGEVTSFVDSGLTPATYYTYRIYAVNDAGQSDPTAPATARTFDAQPSPPATPIAFGAKPVAPRQIFLGWLPGGDPGTVGQTAFVIERCTGEAADCKKGWTVIGKAEGSETSFVDSGLEPATYYTYRIYALNDAGQSDPTAPATARTFASDASSPLPEPVLASDDAREARATSIPLLLPMPPPTPIKLTAEPTSSKEIALAWLPGGDNAVAVGRTIFVIERCIGEAGACLTAFTAIGMVGGEVTSFVDSGLLPATYYTYRVYAVSDAGPSDPTAAATARTFGKAGPLPRPAPDGQAAGVPRS